MTVVRAAVWTSTSSPAMVSNDSSFSRYPPPARPPSFSQLFITESIVSSSLQAFDASNNRLTAMVPAAVVNSTRLIRSHTSRNELSDIIPVEELASFALVTLAPAPSFAPAGANLATADVVKSHPQPHPARRADRGRRRPCLHRQPATVRSAPVILTKLLPTKCSMYCRSEFIFMVDESIQSCFSPPACRSSDAVLCTQHRPWPPPTELRFLSYDAGLRPLPYLSEQHTVNWHSCFLSKPPWIVSSPQNCRGILDQQPQIEEHVSDTSLKVSLDHTGALHPRWCTSDICFVLRSNVRLVPALETRASKSTDIVVAVSYNSMPRGSHLCY